MTSRNAVTPRHSAASDGESLTPRQREILRLVVNGYTNHETAGILGISRRTVEVHRFNLMRRLQVRNVAQLMRVALQKRLLKYQGGRANRVQGAEMTDF